MSELKHLKSEWKAIMSCMGCGDCGYAIRPAVNRYLTCPVKEAKGDEGFEIYFSRGRMNVLKSIFQRARRIRLRMYGMWKLHRSMSYVSK